MNFKRQKHKSLYLIHVLCKNSYNILDMTVKQFKILNYTHKLT